MRRVSVEHYEEVMSEFKVVEEMLENRKKITRDIAEQLIRKIESCRLEAKHYHDKASEEPESYAVWKELQGYYDGRVSAFEWALSALEDS